MLHPALDGLGTFRPVFAMSAKALADIPEYRHPLSFLSHMRTQNGIIFQQSLGTVGQHWPQPQEAATLTYCLRTAQCHDPGLGFSVCHLAVSPAF